MRFGTERGRDEEVMRGKRERGGREREGGRQKEREMGGD